MPFILNGVECDLANQDGVQLNSFYLNGVEVFTGTLPTQSKVHAGDMWGGLSNGGTTNNVIALGDKLLQGRYLGSQGTTPTLWLTLWGIDASGFTEISSVSLTTLSWVGISLDYISPTEFVVAYKVSSTVNVAVGNIVNNAIVMNPSISLFPSLYTLGVRYLGNSFVTYCYSYKLGNLNYSFLGFLDITNPLSIVNKNRIRGSYLASGRYGFIGASADKAQVLLGTKGAGTAYAVDSVQKTFSSTGAGGVTVSSTHSNGEESIHIGGRFVVTSENGITVEGSGYKAATGVTGSRTAGIVKISESIFVTCHLSELTARLTKYSIDNAGFVTVVGSFSFGSPLTPPENIVQNIGGSMAYLPEQGGVVVDWHESYYNSQVTNYLRYINLNDIN
jgi:hypothetical protein